MYIKVSPLPIPLKAVIIAISYNITTTGIILSAYIKGLPPAPTSLKLHTKRFIA